MTGDYLHKGDLGIDYSSYRLNPPNAALVSGCKFVLRYSAGIASRPGHPSHQANKPKLITPAEYAGLDPFYVMLANSEWYEGRITEGTNAGFEDGQADYELWHSCDYPKGYPVFCSWDQYPNKTDTAGVAAYLEGHQRGMDAAAGGRYYLTDLYAGENGIRAIQAQGLAPIGWRTMALSWNDYIPAAETHAAIVQTGNYWYGQQCDENIMARDLALGESTPEDDMTPDEHDLLVKTESYLRTIILDPAHLYSLQGIFSRVDSLEAELAKVKAGVAAVPTTAQVATMLAKIPGEITLTEDQLAALTAALGELVAPVYESVPMNFTFTLHPKTAPPA